MKRRRSRRLGRAVGRSSRNTGHLEGGQESACSNEESLSEEDRSKFREAAKEQWGKWIENIPSIGSRMGDPRDRLAGV